MLSHGLRRRKRRAWQAGAVLALAGSLVLHLLLRRSPPHLATMLVTAAILAALLVFFRSEFYAIGDPRTRWRALAGPGVAGRGRHRHRRVSWRVTRGLDGNYSLWQRIESTVTNTVGFSGAGRVSSGIRATSSPPCAAGSACSR